MKIHLIDGTFELFRCFHGAPRARSTDGQEVGAVRGLLFTMVALLRQPDTTHVAVAFDQMTGRVGADEKGSDSALLRRQCMPAADAVRALGLTIWPMHRYQADDALATGARLYRDEPGVEQVVLCTTDKDLTQCIEGERVVLLDRIRKRITDGSAARDRFGVAPTQIPELFALVGDPSDGLPGVPGWGAKSAAAILSRYPTLEEIPDDATDWDVTVRGAETLARSLRERRREAILMRNLSRLRTDLPIPDTVEDLEWKGARRGVLTELTERVGGAEVLTRLMTWRD
jgi:5'-3' exonuclease